MTTFVTVGNATQAFQRLLDAVASTISELPQPLIIQHGNSPCSISGCILHPFMDMVEFADCIRRSEVIISHAGAGSIIQAIKAGKVPVVMPRLARYGEHVDDHQLELARAFAKLAKVVIVEDATQFHHAIAEAIHKQRTASSLHEESSSVDLLRTVLRSHECSLKNRTFPILMKEER